MGEILGLSSAPLDGWVIAQVVKILRILQNLNPVLSKVARPGQCFQPTFQTSVQDQGVEPMNLKHPWRVVQVQSLTNPELEINLQSVQPRRDGGRIAPRRLKDRGILKPIPPSRVEVRVGDRLPKSSKTPGHQEIPGRLVPQSVSRSKTRAARRRGSSAKAGARSCRPMGRLSFENPQGTLIAGMPAKLAVIV